MKKLHKCKHCGVETTQPDKDCYANDDKELTAVQWLLKHVIISGVKQGHGGLCVDEVKDKVLEMEKMQHEITWENSGNECYQNISFEKYYSETYKTNNK